MMNSNLHVLQACLKKMPNNKKSSKQSKNSFNNNYWKEKFMSCKNGVSRLAKDVKQTDLLITIGHKSVPIMKVSRAFGKTTITYGNKEKPTQVTVSDNKSMVIDEKNYRKNL